VNAPSLNLSGRWLDGAREITISYTGKDTVRAEYVEEYECRNPNDGTLIGTTTLDFEAKITGNQLEGQTNVCGWPTEGITLAKLILTISDDGEELEGLPPDGGWFSTLYNQREAVTITRLTVPELIIDSPAPFTTFAITDAPTMPQIDARAHIRGITPDPTPTTQFDWTVQIQFDAQTCPPHGPVRTIHPPDIVQTAEGGQFTPTFPALRGGELTFLVRATVNGQTLTASTQGLKVQGTNPDRTLINATLPNKTLRRIACWESGMRQFDAGVDGEVSSCPLWSGDNLGGVGIMQITDPPPTDDQVWDWIANVTAGINKLNQTTAAARQYPGQVRNSPFWGPVVTSYNRHRQQQGLPALLRIDLPDFTTGDFDDNLQQVEFDAIRGYNGWAGTDIFGPLHEYRVAFDANGLLRVTVAPDGTTGTAQWEQVPTAERPQNVGDPNYVANVLRQSPTCGV
jgi:hypothetical protein